MQYITCLALPVDLLAWFEQPGGCGIAFQDIDVLVHNKYRQRHGIEQDAMQPLIQKLNGEPVHNTVNLAGLGQKRQQKKQG